MPVNRYDVPAQLVTRDSFYQLPFEQMAAALASRQGAYDETEAGYQELALKQFQNLTADDPKAHAARQWQAGLSDVVYNDFDGDFSQGQESLRRAQKQVAQRFGPAGDIGAMSAAVKSAAEMDEWLKEQHTAGHITANDVRLAKQHFLKQYEDQGGIGEGDEYGRYSPFSWSQIANTYDFDEYSKQFKDFKEDMFENYMDPVMKDGKFIGYKTSQPFTLPDGTQVAAGTWYNKQDGNFYKTSKFVGGVPEASVHNAFMTGIIHDPKFQAWNNTQSMINPNYTEEYRNDMLSDLANRSADIYGNIRTGYDEEIRIVENKNNARRTAGGLAGVSGTSTGHNITFDPTSKYEATKNLEEGITVGTQELTDLLKTDDDYAFSGDINAVYEILADPEGKLGHLSDREKTQAYEHAKNISRDHAIVAANKAWDQSLLEAAGLKDENLLTPVLESYIENVPPVGTANIENVEKLKEVFKDPTFIAGMLKYARESEDDIFSGESDAVELAHEMAGHEYLGIKHPIDPLGSLDQTPYFYFDNAVREAYQHFTKEYEETIAKPMKDGFIANYVTWPFSEVSRGNEGFRKSVINLEAHVANPNTKFTNHIGETGTLSQHLFEGEQGHFTKADYENFNAQLMPGWYPPRYMVTADIKKGVNKDKNVTKILETEGLSGELSMIMTDILDAPEGTVTDEQVYNAELHMGARLMGNWNPDIINQLPAEKPFPLYDNQYRLIGHITKYTSGNVTTYEIDEKTGALPSLPSLINSNPVEPEKGTTSFSSPQAALAAIYRTVRQRSQK